MNRQQRRATSRTAPEPLVWEAVLVELNGSDPEPLEGVLLLLERGMPRDYFKVRPGASFGQFVRRAAAISTYGQRARLPDRIRCADPALVARLRADLTDLGVRVDLVSSLPDADVFAGFVRQTFDPGPAPGPEGDLPRWRAVIAELARTAPWEVLDPTVGFSLGDGPLAGRYATVHGGPTRAGILLFDSHQDWQDYWCVASLGATPRFSGVALWIAPPADVPPEEVLGAREMGIALPDGRIPYVAAMLDGASRPVTPFDGRRVLAAAEVLVAARARGIERTSKRTPVGGTSTILGRQEATFLGCQPELVVREQLLCVFIGLPRPDGTAPTGIVLQLTPGDARRVAKQLRGADGVVLRDMDGDLGVVLYRDGAEIGLVAVVPADVAHTVEAAAATGRLDLAVSRAGVKAPGTLRSDLVLTLPLAVVTEPVSRGGGIAPHVSASA